MHPIKLTLLKCIIQWGLVHPQSCTLIPEHVITLIRNHIPITLTSYPSRPWQSLTSLLPLLICLFWTFNVSGIITVCGLLCLVSFTYHNYFKVHSYCRISVLNSFLWLNNIPCMGYYILYIPSLIDWHLGCFQFFGYYE